MTQTSDGASWASLASKGSLRRLEKNVMEVILEKDDKGGFNTSENDTARLLQKLGVDLGSHCEMVQICPLGRNVIQVTLKKDVNMEKFFNKEVFEVSSGVRVSHIRSAGQREVTLLIKGLHPQTPDSIVFEYLKCMGKVEKSKVVLDTFKDGPLKGLQNGDRRYVVEFNPNLAIGTLHIIDGQKVTFSFPGQRRSCFRCLNVSHECPGYGIARECEAAGGSKKLLAMHMQEFWKKINFSPVVAPIVDDASVDPDIIEQQIGGTFTPKVKQNVSEVESIRKFGAVSIKWFPKKADHGDILEFLVGHGLPLGHESVNVKDNGQVIVSDLDPKISEKLCESITGSKFNKLGLSWATLEFSVMPI